MHITHAGLQTTATVVQLMGGLVTGYGIFYAWNRARARFDNLLKSIEQLSDIVVSDLKVAWREYFAWNKPVNVRADLRGGSQLGVGTEVKMSGGYEERLHLLENLAAKLPGQVEDAIKAAVAKYKAEAKGLALRDTSWALAGVFITMIGTVMRLFL